MDNKAPSEKQHSPIRTLLSLAVFGVVCMSIAFFWPEEDIALSEGLAVKFATIDDFLPSEKEDQGIQSAEEFLKAYDVILNEDSIAELEMQIADSLLQIEEQQRIAEETARRRALLKIQSGEEGIRNIQEFFSACRDLNTNKQKLQVLHYGDSQIEGDRITRYFRNELQKRFGGYGPGLVPPVEVVPSSAIKQRFEGDWKRYTIYGKKDTTVAHSRYGIMGTFASYDSIGGSLFFEPSNIAFGKVRKFTQIDLFYGAFGAGAEVSAYSGDSLVATKTIADSSGLGNLRWSLASTPKELELRFNGGPVECYALQLEGAGGVQVSNIPMRGSSGTIFKKIDRPQMAYHLRELFPKMILLQYGGNTVPYVTDSTKAENYGKWVSSQIRYLQSILPSTAFILIGPSDMAHKVGDQFVTYEYLEPVRNALKKAAFDNGCGFWDIYEVMGGRNSMEAWVNADPALAGADYVHFTPKGARKIGELFTKAFFDLEKAQQEQENGELKMESGEEENGELKMESGEEENGKLKMEKKK